MKEKSKAITEIGLGLLLICFICVTKNTNLTVSDNPLLSLATVVSVILVILGIEMK